MKNFKEWLRETEQLLNEGKDKDIKKILDRLQRKGFRIEHGAGSRAKIYPPDRSLPFYSMHIGDEAIHPLRRFASKNWGIEDVRREEEPVIGVIGTKLPKAV